MLGPGEAALMIRLTWAFLGRLCDLFSHELVHLQMQIKMLTVGDYNVNIRYVQL